MNGLRIFVRVATQLAILGNAEPTKFDGVTIDGVHITMGGRMLSVQWHRRVSADVEKGYYEALLFGLDDEYELHIPYATLSEIRELVLAHLAN